jgi:hypothetical protein
MASNIGVLIMIDIADLSAFPDIEEKSNRLSEFALARWRSEVWRPRNANWRDAIS